MAKSIWPWLNETDNSTDKTDSDVSKRKPPKKITQLLTLIFSIIKLYIVFSHHFTKKDELIWINYEHTANSNKSVLQH